MAAAIQQYCCQRGGETYRQCFTGLELCVTVSLSGFQVSHAREQMKLEISMHSAWEPGTNSNSAAKVWKCCAAAVAVNGLRAECKTCLCWY
eukprot:1547510-Rhodomonas_salina.1